MLPRIRQTLPALIGIAFLSLSAEARAAPPQQRGAFDGGAYFQISPGPVAVVIDEYKFSRDARWAWPWSLGAGWMFTRGSLFKGTLGATVEHSVIVLDNMVPHAFRAVAESRIGAGNGRVWGYGLLGIGATMLLVRWDRNSNEDFYGIAAQFGGGVQGLVGRRFFVGGEIDFDIGYYFSTHRELQDWDSFYYQTATIEINLGWHF